MTEVNERRRTKKAPSEGIGERAEEREGYFCAPASSPKWKLWPPKSGCIPSRRKMPYFTLTHKKKVTSERLSRQIALQLLTYLAQLLPASPLHPSLPPGVRFARFSVDVLQESCFRAPSDLISRLCTLFGFVFPAVL